MSFEDLDADHLLSGEVLHLTGITLALSESCRGLTECLIAEANERGVPVSFDANVRWRLFEGLGPREVLGPLVARADVLFLSEDEAELLVGGKDPETIQRENLRAKVVVVHGAEGAFALGVVTT